MLPGDSVTLTNDDATQCKRHAVSMNYWQDPYISYLSKQAPRKTPEISRGYFARVFAVRSFVSKFLKRNSCDCQVVSLGAGFDTLYWNLKSMDLVPLKYVEIDLPPVTRQKTTAILSRKDKLLSLLGEDVTVTGNKMGVTSEHYSLMPADLRDLNNLDMQLKACKVDFSKPTLFMTECVLMYLPNEDTDKLLSFVAENFPCATFLSYDVINMNDKFAEVMMSNLVSRQCYIYTQYCQSKQTQIERYSKNGWKTCEVHEMTEVYQQIAAQERSRVERIEMLDEVHLFQELMNHYCICLAATDRSLLLSLEDLGHIS